VSVPVIDPQYCTIVRGTKQIVSVQDSVDKTIDYTVTAMTRADIVTCVEALVKAITQYMKTVLVNLKAIQSTTDTNGMFFDRAGFCIDVIKELNSIKQSASNAFSPPPVPPYPKVAATDATIVLIMKYILSPPIIRYLCSTRILVPNSSHTNPIPIAYSSHTHPILVPYRWR